jgi:hypothetical protein
VAAGDGRITAEELDERLEAALTARTYSELAALTADLPTGRAPGFAVPKPKDVIRISRHGGNATSHAGRWVVPKRMEIRLTGGNVRLDFTEAVISEPSLQMDIRIHGGNLVIVTRPGVVVDATEVAMVGGRVVNRSTDQSHAPAVLAVELTGEMTGGHVRVGPPQPPRRTFWQWLFRHPRPAARPENR